MNEGERCWIRQARMVGASIIVEPRRCSALICTVEAVGNEYESSEHVSTILYT
jgi:hypothetical protein